MHDISTIPHHNDVAFMAHHLKCDDDVVFDIPLYISG